MTVNEKIIELVNPEYMKRLLFFIKKHAIAKACELIAREFPDIYAEFEKNEINDDTKAQMSKIVNDIFEERMKKHNL